MFTHNPVTPLRVEVLIDLLRTFRDRSFGTSDLVKLFQPEGLPGLSPTSKQARHTIEAAGQLGLIDSGEEVKISREYQRDKRPTREMVTDAIDAKILSGTEVEPYFALFYSYLLGLGNGAGVKKDSQTWANDFNLKVHGGELTSNPFNGPKYDGLNRWLSYAGLGWYDPDGVFQCNPYERMLRRLPTIFGKQKKLSSEEFMGKLAAACPELDGGEIFLRANQDFSPAGKMCSLGVSHALIDLHEDEIIRLHCPRDSRGWSIDVASPPNDGKTLQGPKIDFVERL